MRYRLEGGNGGVLAIRDKATGEIHPRDYTPVEAQQVVDWLNGTDCPLTAVNVNDWPGHECKPEDRQMMSMRRFRQEMAEPWPMRRP